MVKNLVMVFTNRNYNLIKVNIFRIKNMEMVHIQQKIAKSQEHFSITNHMEQIFR